MNAKKIIALLLTLILTLGVCVALSSCMGGEDPTPPVCQSHTDVDGDGVCDSEGCNEPVAPAPPAGGGEDDGEVFNENGELYLYKDGAPTFTFVCGNDVGAARGAIDSLAGVLSPLGSSAITVIEHNKEGMQDVEILFGTVNNRGDDYKINKYDLGMNGYIVKQIGTKIVVLGGSVDSLKIAVDYLKNNVFKIKKSTEKFTDYVMSADMNKEYIVSGYSLTDVKIGDNSIRDYTLTYKRGDNTSKNLVSDIQGKLYAEAGIWLPIKVSSSGEPEANTLSIVFSIVEKDIEQYGEAGFEIIIDDDENLVIQTQYENKLTEVFNKILNDKILKTRGIYTFREESIDVRNIYYSEFGADITGEDNAIEEIIDCHAYANQYGHIVNAVKPGETNVTFKITRTNGAFATIATDVNWTGASFIIDDSWLMTGDTDDMRANIFCIPRVSGEKWFSPSDDAEEGSVQKALAMINAAGGLDKETFNSELRLDLHLGRRALVFIYNKNHKNYVRFGVNEDSGADQMEFVLVDEEGNVDTNTPLLYDFDEITSIKVIYVDDEELSVTGGTFTTIANKLPRNYNWYTYRGIQINRSNVTLDGLTHYIEGEGVTGAPYSGFLTISGTNNVRVQNTVLTGHRAYDLEGSEGTNTMGTYDISPSSSNNTYFYNVTQTNFLIDDPNAEGKQVTSIGNGYWGIMGGNDCKNLTYDTCRLTRFDSHRGTTNGTIIHSDVAAIAVIGGGTLTIEDTNIYMSSGGGSHLVTLRDDYGATWNGEFIFKDVNVVMHHAYSGNTLSLISGTWRVSNYATHDFGYDCYMPHTVTVDNLTCSSSSVKTVNLASGTITAPNNAITINPYYVTEKFIVRNNHAGFEFIKSIPTAEMIEEPVTE